MSDKKKGFTLVEVLVVMLVATLVFAMVGGTMVFITTTSGELLHQSEEIELAKNIEEYLRTLDNSQLSAVKCDEETNWNLLLGDETVFSDTGLVEFSIDPSDGFNRCHMKFESGRHFDFIVGNVQ